MTHQRTPAHALAAIALCLAAVTAVPAAAQTTDAESLRGQSQEGHQWQEGDVPAPPAHSQHDLVDIERRGAGVRLGVSAQSLQPDQASGVVRYVVVARGATAVNASYEGIRCATGEHRVYARQTGEGSPWVQQRSGGWQPLGSQGLWHPLWLAKNGLCQGKAMTGSAGEMLRLLKSGGSGDVTLYGS